MPHRTQAGRGQQAAQDCAARDRKTCIGRMVRHMIGLISDDYADIRCGECGKVTRRLKRGPFCDLRCRKAAKAKGPEEYRRLVALDKAQTRKPKDTGVYIVEAVGTGLYKIGYTAVSIDSRLSGLQTGSPIPLRVACFIRGGDRDTEALLHGRFASDRVHGEWFKGSARLLEYIDEVRRVGGELSLCT